MKNLSVKRILAFVLAAVMCLGAVPTLAPEASAATNSTVASQLSSRLPLVTYAMPLSGAAKVYSYSDATLNTKTTGYYIDSFKDQIVITKISADGRALYVSYPSSSSSTGYRSRWFAADDILGLATVGVQAYTCSSKNTTYRMTSGSGVTSYGSISAGDACLKLGSHAVGGKTYYPTVYPISSGTYNKVSGVRYKLALGSFAPSTGGTTTSSGWRMPMDNAYCTWSSYSNMSWATYTNRSGDRDYHLGIDIYGTGGRVYAAADGKVVACSSSTSGANGRFIILQHTISGKTVYSFYAHLSSLNVSKGQTVSKGTQIAVAGGSGNGSNSAYGTHLHFAIVDTLWTSGGYYGYATKFTGNKVNYSGVTYYNPVYVINNNRLP